MLRSIREKKPYRISRAKLVCSWLFHSKGGKPDIFEYTIPVYNKVTNTVQERIVDSAGRLTYEQYLMIFEYLNDISSELHLESMTTN